MIAIAAMSLNRAIGLNGQIPWHLSEDLRFFKRVTLGHIMVMGRKTYDSLGRPLPGRESWVVTRGGPISGVRTFAHPSEVPVTSADGREVFLIGGAQLYAALLPQCTALYLTIVQREVMGDAFFPEFESEFSTFTVEQLGEGYEIRKYSHGGDPDS